MKGILLLALANSITAQAPPAAGVIYIDLENDITKPDIIAAQTCVGLLNRPSQGNGAMSLTKPDYTWLKLLWNITDPPLTPVTELLNSKCLNRVAKGYIRYNYTAQQRLLPNIFTLAAVLDAVPLEVIYPHIVPYIFKPLQFLRTPRHGTLRSTRHHHANQQATISTTPHRKKRRIYLK
jgi:hypothetical protein